MENNLLMHKIKTVACTINGSYGRFTVSGDYTYDINRGIISARLSMMTENFGSLITITSDGQRSISVPQGENMAEVSAAATEIFEQIEAKYAGGITLNS